MKRTAFFDIETNGIEDWATLTDLKTVHCMVVIGNKNTYRFEPGNIRAGLDLLDTYDQVVGHNAIGFDGPALELLYGWRHDGLADTMILSKLSYPDLRNDDFKRVNFPKTLIGSHSLKAWGYRIGVHKDSFGETSDWSKYSDEMMEYCVQDVEVTYSLFDYLLTKGRFERRSYNLENDFAIAMHKQEYTGFPFDVPRAEKLTQELMGRRAALTDELKTLFPPSYLEMKSHLWVTSDGKTWKTKKAAVEAGHDKVEKGPKKTKEVPFNPQSRDQIAERLINSGWKPKAYEGKRPAINESVLKDVGTPEALKLLEYLLVSKRLGQVAEGNQAWLKLVTDKGRIHGRVNTNGAVSGRCTHNNPNVAQVPAVRAEYGKACRECFTAPKGRVLVGADASGLELRCLAHYLHPWDEGAYATEILEGDIHSANQQAAGLDTRDQAKTFIYAFLYGAGDAKIGQIVGGSSKDGKRLKANFMSKTPAIKHLTDAVAKKVQATGQLKGIDGRVLPCRSEHSALNLLLQSCGAVIMKQALVLFEYLMTDADYELHANIHDEVQFSCKATDADFYGKIFVDCIKKAGEELDFKCPLDGEYGIGMNWSETH